MELKNILFTSLLVTAFLVTSIMSLQIAKKITTAHQSSQNSPNFFMTDVVYYDFDIDGKIINQIEASKMSHFKTNDNYLFKLPKITTHSAKNQEIWRITARYGSSTKGKSVISLWDKVTATKIQSTTDNYSDISTDSANFYPTTKFLETTSQVKIVENNHITEATGAKADLKSGIIKLISNVKTQYLIH